MGFTILSALYENPVFFFNLWADFSDILFPRLQIPIYKLGETKILKLPLNRFQPKNQCF